MTAALRFPRGLYGITPEWDDTDKMLHAIEEAAAGGMVALQWRRKATDAQSGLAQARRIVQRCRELKIVSIINDDWRLAALVDADGVHLGRDDDNLDKVRTALGTDKLIGCSCYDLAAMATQALAAGADYIAFGAVYPSTIKPNAPRASLALISEGRRLTLAQPGPARASVVAIGGITAENAQPIVQAGADNIALISGLFEAPDIRAAARRCAQLFASPAT